VNRLFPIVSAGKSGLLSGGVQLLATRTPTPAEQEAAEAAAAASGGGGGAFSGWGRQGSMLMGLIGQVLEHVRCVTEDTSVSPLW
jgi:hypothetical protein